MPIISADALREWQSDLQGLSDPVLDGYVAEFEALYLHERGVAPAATEATLIRPGVDSCTIQLPTPVVIALSGVTIDATEVDVEADLASGALILWSNGQIHRAAGWSGTSITLAWSHGLDPTPAEVVRACRLFVWRTALADLNPNAGNAYASATSDVSTSYPTTTVAGPTSWPDVNEAIKRQTDYREPGLA